MWAKLRAANSRRDDKELREARKSLNINEEYLSALRTKSFAECFSKAQLFVTEPSSPSCRHENFSEILLEPDQDTIPSILESAVLSKLLKNINDVRHEYRFIQRALDTADDDQTEPHDKVKLIVSNLNSLIILTNPFSNPSTNEFKVIHDKYSSVLHNLKSKRKKVARKIKLINYVHKASGICITAVCSLIAIAAVVLAAHALTALLIGPMILSFPTKCFKKKLFNFRFLRSGFLRKVRKQLDVAAKGTYILNRDFDTMGRLVARLHDEVEHNKVMIRFCLDRREDKFALHVMKEIKKNHVGFQKQVEELEEHVYLCLVTINRARSQVIKEMVTSSSCVEELR
ncbi:UPF0496 protein [Citrus sinensis]|uniref:UPF0496 protein n=1 Tax=Citrus sinensis TaxID=2711 RepID=A0ACB8KT44_CITSI|nr:UPF0496 protein [Citrus sinensis]